MLEIASLHHCISKYWTYGFVKLSGVECFLIAFVLKLHAIASYAAIAPALMRSLTREPNWTI